MSTILELFFSGPIFMKIGIVIIFIARHIIFSTSLRRLAVLSHGERKMVYIPVLQWLTIEDMVGEIQIGDFTLSSPGILMIVARTTQWILVIIQIFLGTSSLLLLVAMVLMTLMATFLFICMVYQLFLIFAPDQSAYYTIFSAVSQVFLFSMLLVFTEKGIK